MKQNEIQDISGILSSEKEDEYLKKGGLVTLCNIR